MLYGCEWTDAVEAKQPSLGLTLTSDINPAFRTAVKRAGLNLTLHDLRRVYLNRLDLLHLFQQDSRALRWTQLHSAPIVRFTNAVATLNAAVA